MRALLIATVDVISATLNYGSDDVITMFRPGESNGSTATF
jgi:hypothetical protein